MISSWLLFPTVLGLLAALVNLTRRQWLLNLIALSAQYLAAFLLLVTLAPLSLAFVKLLVGWMSALTLYITLASFGNIFALKQAFKLSYGQAFRAFAGVLAVFSMILTLPVIQRTLFPQASEAVLLVSFSLMLLGLLQVAMISEPLYLIIGLLTFLTGFELLYAALEFSTLLEALFAGVNLGLALVGAYFLIKDQELSSQ